jgi:hypothetical protein
MPFPRMGSTNLLISSTWVPSLQSVVCKNKKWARAGIGVARDPLRLRSGQAFDCVAGSLREPATSLRMTIRNNSQLNLLQGHFHIQSVG